MSIQSEIARIDSNIANSLLKVAAKGVTVPDNASSNDLPNLIEQISVGIELPALSNPASDSEIFAGYDAINETGERVAGAFTLDTELTTLEAHITELETALEGKAAGGGSGETLKCSLTLAVYEEYFDGSISDAVMGIGYCSNGQIVHTQLTDITEGMPVKSVTFGDIDVNSIVVLYAGGYYFTIRESENIALIVSTSEAVAFSLPTSGTATIYVF